MVLMDILPEFKKLGLSDIMLDALKDKGFEVPSPIQEQTIPLILESSTDLLGQAQTGTGKTAAFGLPIIDMMDENPGPARAIILSPTRELAVQIADELNSLKGRKRLHIIPIYGGQPIERQIGRLKSGVDIIVGTPGRVLDLLRRGAMQLGAIRFLVFDEADEMLNLGFKEEVEEILKTINCEKRTFMFCATMPKEILSLAKKYMKDYRLIKIESEQMTTNLTDQIYFEVDETNKFDALCRIIDYEMDFYGIVFCRTKVDVDSVTNKLVGRGYDAEVIHGDISQVQREKALNKFKSREVNILVATDVAARGIDVQNLTHVINYAMPQDAESYVHRVGRTGRAGNEGTAITFVTRRESRNLLLIQKQSKTAIRKGKLPGVKDIIELKKKWIKGEVFATAETEIEETYRTFAHDMLRGCADPEELMAALIKFTFHMELDPSNYREIGSAPAPVSDPVRLFIALGKKDGMTKRSLVELIKSKAKTNSGKINDVQVFDAYSFITVPFREAEFILNVFKKDNAGRRPIIEMADKKRK